MIRYFKHQFQYLIFLLGVFVIPLGLFLHFSPYQVPKVSYVVMGALFISQYVFYREKEYRSKIRDKVTKVLKSEAGRIPSGKEVIRRSDQIIQFRGVSIVTCALCVLVLMFIYKAF